MTNEQILKKVIEKAVGNGWYEGEAIKNLLVIFPRYAGKTSLMEHYHRSIIFSHSFAKAFWGEWEMIAEDKTGVPIPFKFESATQRGSGMCIWQHHLQQMVLEDEPLQYLAKFL